jgi:hypothetical protein
MSDLLELSQPALVARIEAAPVAKPDLHLLDSLLVLTVPLDSNSGFTRCQSAVRL